MTSGTLASPERRRGQTKGAGLVPANRTWRSRRWSRSSPFFLLWLPHAAQGCSPWRCGSEDRRPRTGEETAGGRLGLFVRLSGPGDAQLRTGPPCLSASPWPRPSKRLAKPSCSPSRLRAVPRPASGPGIAVGTSSLGRPAGGPSPKCGPLLLARAELPKVWRREALLFSSFLLLLPRPLCREALPGLGGSGVRVFVGRQGELIREGMTRARRELCGRARGRQAGGRRCLPGKGGWKTYSCKSVCNGS